MREETEINKVQMKGSAKKSTSRQGLKNNIKLNNFDMKKVRLPYWTSLFFPILALVLASKSGYSSSVPEEAKQEPAGLIEVSTYSVKVLAKSNSNLIYLLEDSLSIAPREGHLILLKNETHLPVMALRVLKTYPELKAFAAKFIKRYEQVDTLEEGQTFTAVEKVIDLVDSPTSLKDQTDLKEFEIQKSKIIQPTSVPVLNALIDTAPSPSPLPSPLPSSGPLTEASAGVLPAKVKSEATVSPKEPEANSKKEEDLEEGGDQPLSDPLDIATSRNIDKYSYWISAGLGAIRSGIPSAPAQTQFLNAGVGRFGYTLSHPGIIHGSTMQDSWVVEGAIYGFKVIGSGGDSYTLVSFVPTLRYNLSLGEHLSIFGYAGIAGNFPIAASNANQITLSSLRSFFPALGAGLLFQIGPGWYTRLDGGLESISLNLLLRF